MPNRRARIHSFYEPVKVAGTPAVASGYQCCGTQSCFTVVVRADLNGFSDWCRDQEDIAPRVDLLNDFFSTLVPLLTVYGGVYFRDEGDCVVAVFSDYFQLGATSQKVLSFCQDVVSHTYGADGLSAKAIVTCGDVAYFQKTHELNTDDWSAEGQPFVTAARLEQAIESRPHIVFLQDDYERHFPALMRGAYPGTRCFWWGEARGLHVPKLGLPGGWTRIFTLTHVPGGRVQP